MAGLILENDVLRKILLLDRLRSKNWPGNCRGDRGEVKIGLVIVGGD